MTIISHLHFSLKLQTQIQIGTWHLYLVSKKDFKPNVSQIEHPKFYPLQTTSAHSLTHFSQCQIHSSNYLRKYFGVFFISFSPFTSHIQSIRKFYGLLSKYILNKLLFVLLPPWFEPLSSLMDNCNQILGGLLALTFAPL